MDTYIHINSFKCRHCYKCVRLSIEKDKYGGLGCFMLRSNGTPTYYNDYVSCHHCSAEVDGEETCYPCAKICPSGAIEIERW